MAIPRFKSGDDVEQFLVQLSEALDNPALERILSGGFTTPTTRTFVPPSMTTTEKNAITELAPGMIVWDSTLARLERYSGSAWGAV